MTKPNTDILDVAHRLCMDCRQEFTLTEREVEFYTEKVAEDPQQWKFPRRCRNCRLAKKGL